MRKRQILILEDNYEMKIFLKQYFKKKFNITTVSNISDAINEIEKEEFDLILTDINLNLGDVNGFDFIKYIKTTESHKNTPIVVLSAKDTAEDKINALRLGVNDYVTKPFHPEELYLRIRNLINK